jgi:hypothetical protein
MFRSNSADTVSATIDDLGSILGDKYVRKHGHVQKAISTIFTRAFATSNPSAWGVAVNSNPWQRMRPCQLQALLLPKIESIDHMDRKTPSLADNPAQMGFTCRGQCILDGLL